LKQQCPSEVARLINEDGTVKFSCIEERHLETFLGSDIVLIKNNLLDEYRQSHKRKFSDIVPTHEDEEGAKELMEIDGKYFKSHRTIEGLVNSLKCGFIDEGLEFPENVSAKCTMLMKVYKRIVASKEEDGEKETTVGKKPLRMSELKSVSS
jgi:hypothetical protein